jgi:hypothetical protein
MGFVEPRFENPHQKRHDNPGEDEDYAHGHEQGLQRQGLSVDKRHQQP